ncbi:MAG: SRPBCC family protein [Dehalococcoidia bacterium]
MPIDVTATIEIRRPIAEVWAFLADTGNDTRWIRALSKVQPLTPGPIATGSRVRRVASMMGRKIDYTTEVTELDAGRRVAMKTLSGPPMLVDYLLAEAPGGGTQVRVRNRGGRGLLFAGPLAMLMGRMVNGRVKGDLQALKAALESAG